MMRDILAEALRRQAAHERHQANLWVRAALWHAHDPLERETGLRRAEEYEQRADLYQEWAQAIELDLPVDYVRFGCRRAALAVPTIEDWLMSVMS